MAFSPSIRSGAATCVRPAPLSGREHYPILWFESHMLRPSDHVGLELVINRRRLPRETAHASPSSSPEGRPCGSRGSPKPEPPAPDRAPGPARRRYEVRTPT